MGGLLFYGCGAKDYFTKIKYLGEKQCPTCKKIAPFYLEKGSLKASVFWVPTVTLKERYAIMCEKCKNGKWIENSEVQKILSGNVHIPIETASEETGMSYPKCRKCGEVVDGAFCGKCGAKYEK